MTDACSSTACEKRHSRRQNVQVANSKRSRGPLARMRFFWFQEDHLETAWSHSQVIGTPSERDVELLSEEPAGTTPLPSFGVASF